MYRLTASQMREGSESGYITLLNPRHCRASEAFHDYQIIRLYIYPSYTTPLQRYSSHQCSSQGNRKFDVFRIWILTSDFCLRRFLTYVIVKQDLDRISNSKAKLRNECGSISVQLMVSIGLLLLKAKLLCCVC
jgi:hypothetical protein